MYCSSKTEFTLTLITSTAINWKTHLKYRMHFKYSPPITQYEKFQICRILFTQLCLECYRTYEIQLPLTGPMYRKNDIICTKAVSTWT